VYVERAWAYGLTLKSEFAMGERSGRGKIRHRYIKKFNRAAYWAKQVVELAGKFCDSQTQLEAAAYCEWMTGLAMTESGEYQEALKIMSQSSDKYTQLIKDSLDTVFPNASKAYKHRITDLEPIQRVCKYKLRVGLIPSNAPEEEDHPARPRAGSDEFESANELSDDEGIFEFSDNDYEDSDIEMSPSTNQKTNSGLLGKIGGWWNKGSN